MLHLLRNIDGDAAQFVDEINESMNVEDDVMIDWNAQKLADGRLRQVWTIRARWRR